MQKEITKKNELLNNQGHLNDVGFSKQMILRYNKQNIKKQCRIKEWDYYYIADDNVALCLTISNLSYAGVLSVSVIDFQNQKHYDKTSLMAFPKEKVSLPATSLRGTSSFETKAGKFTFEVQDGKRHLFGVYKNFFNKNKARPDLEFDIVLSDEPKESMVKVTPFKNKNHFYYNQKINCMNAEGYFTFDGKKYNFYKDTTLATLDWGRGVLPYHTKWYWASFNCKTLYGKTLGFNFGKALGNNEDATENMVFYDGKAHKIEKVDINIPRKNNRRDYLGTWTFYSSDGRVELVFEPILDRYVPFNALVLAFIPHQVFGRYSGKVVLDDGTVIKIENRLGFAERVVNLW